MDNWRGWDKISYQSDLDPRFAEEIASIPGGDKLFACIQCGTCSGMCPLSSYMDVTPRQIIAMIRAGFKGDVLSSYTTWLCASCYACSVECPKQIKITDIMYAAKRLAIREGVYPKKFPIPILASEFFSAVEKNGRSSEGRLIMKFVMKTNPLNMFKQAGLGLKLLLTGRFSIKRESVERVGELNSMMRFLEMEHMIKKASDAVGVKEDHK